MPSTKKTLHFMSSMLATTIAVGVIGYGMSTEWAKTTVQCARDGTANFNGTAVVTLLLFGGSLERTFCPSFGGDKDFSVITQLTRTGGAPLVLHVLVVCLLVLCLLCSAISMLVSLYNSFSNPYETYLGPISIYVCSSLSACLSVVALIIFVLNVNVTSIAEELIRDFAGGTPVALRKQSSEMRLGYYLLIPYVVLSLVAVALIYMYNHAAYTHRREQQRPTENAPKEIMMY